MFRTITQGLSNINILIIRILSAESRCQVNLKVGFLSQCSPWSASALRPAGCMLQHRPYTRIHRLELTIFLLPFNFHRSCMKPCTMRCWTPWRGPPHVQYHTPCASIRVAVSNGFRRGRTPCILPFTPLFVCLFVSFFQARHFLRERRTRAVLLDRIRTWAHK